MTRINLKQLNRLSIEYPILNDWFAFLMQEESSEISWIIQLMNKDSEHFEELVWQVSEAVRLLPERPVRLQDYSRLLTQDPQGLNPEKELGWLFFHALAEDTRKHTEQDVSVPTNEKERHHLLSQFNLIYDELIDQVSIANLFAETAESYHPVWESAVHTHSVLTLSVRDCLELSTVYPAHEKSIVWIIENSRIFSSLLDEVANVPMICTHGEFSFAAREVMDRLVEEGYRLRYSGELTPEGISKAEKWLMRYPETLEPWKMDVESYLKVRDPHIKLSMEGLVPLYDHSMDQLACLKDEMKDQKRPANLARLLDEMISELKYHYQQ